MRRLKSAHEEHLYQHARNGDAPRQRHAKKQRISRDDGDAKAIRR
jgi:hypothetical protein